MHHLCYFTITQLKIFLLENHETINATCHTISKPAYSIRELRQWRRERPAKQGLARIGEWHLQRQVLFSGESNWKLIVRVCVVRPKQLFWIRQIIQKFFQFLNYTLEIRSDTAHLTSRRILDHAKVYILSTQLTSQPDWCLNIWYVHYVWGRLRKHIQHHVVGARNRQLWLIPLLESRKAECNTVCKSSFWASVSLRFMERLGDRHRLTCCR